MSAPLTTRPILTTGFVCLSSHGVRLHDRAAGRNLVIDPSGVLCRVRERRCFLGRIDGWPVFGVEWAELVGLPDPAPGVVYVASARVARLAAELDRADVVAPDSDFARRDSQGRVLSVQGFFRPGAEVRYGLPRLTHAEVFRGAH